MSKLKPKLGDRRRSPDWHALRTVCFSDSSKRALASALGLSGFNEHAELLDELGKLLGTYPVVVGATDNYPRNNDFLAVYSELKEQSSRLY